MRCILVSENAIFRQKLEEVLAAEGFPVLPGVEVVSDLPALAPDMIVVLDLSARSDEACAHISRWRAAHPGLRVVALTTRSLQDGILRTCGQLLDGLLLASHPIPVILGALHAVAVGYRVLPEGDAGEPRETVPAPRRHPPRDPSGLSERETAILDEICRGATNKEIANRLHINETTVKVHLRGIFRTIGVSNRTQAALWALGQRDPAHERARM